MASENKTIINPSRSPVQNARRTKALLSRPKLLSKVQRNERRRSRDNEPLTESQKNTQRSYSGKMLPVARAIGNKMREQNGQKLDAKDIKNVVNIAKDATTVYSTLSPLLIFVPVQFAFAVISLLGLAAEIASTNFAFGILNAVVPGMTLFVAGLAVVMLIGFGSILYAVVALSLRGINCFKNRRDLVLMLCIIAYIAPVFNMVPWVFVFGLFTLKP